MCKAAYIAGRAAAPLVAVLLTFLTLANAGMAEEVLARGFTSPPPSARPWVYWFWLDGNITREGITADLEAMARAGIGGVLIMEVAQGSPKGPVAFASPQWRELFQFVLGEAHRLGIEVRMNNDAGWCGSGGPWITPELAMQKLIAAETSVQGPTRLEGALPQPPAVKDFYRDVAVLAFPTPEGEDVDQAADPPAVSASVSGEDFKPQRLFDGKPPAAVTLPRPEPDRPQWIQLEYPQPRTVRTVTMSIVGNPRFGIHGAVEASQDGQKFTMLREFDGQAPTVVISLPETSARWYRLTFTRFLHPRLNKLKITEIELSAGPWQVTFDPKWGGPAEPVDFPSLADWTQRPEDGIRYYSGTATYRTTFSRPADDIQHPQSRILLDLGRVEVVATVKLNSRDLGILWKGPYRVDVTGVLKPDQNELEITVTNLWINRQIGDGQLPEDSDRNPNGTLRSWPQWLLDGKPSPTGRYTFTSWRLWKKDDPLAESGLLGPVVLHTIQRRVVRF